MKKAITFLISSVFAFAVAAQGYLPVLQEDSYWIALGNECDGNQLPRRFELDGDTVIDNLPYKILRMRFCTTPDPIYGFARTNSTNSKLWFRALDGEEALIMDMDLEVGDFFSGMPEGHVTQVGVLNGRKTITIGAFYVGWCIVGDEERLQFIEGIGPNSGWAIYHDYLLLDCAGTGTDTSYSDDVTWWQNSCGHPCFIDPDLVPPIQTDPEPQAPTAELKIAFGAVTLQSESLQPFQLRIYDAMGRTVQVHELTAGTSISLQALPAAWYVLSLYDTRGRRVLSKKTVIH